MLIQRIHPLFNGTDLIENTITECCQLFFNDPAALISLNSKSSSNSILALNNACN